MTVLRAEDVISLYQLQPHLEGGAFVETCVSDKKVKKLDGIGVNDTRFAMTSILFLMKNQQDFSAFHRVKSDELWLFQAGNTTIKLHLIDEQGHHHTVLVGDTCQHDKATPHYLVKAGIWFAAEPAVDDWVMASCVVAPGFVFEDFSLASAELLSAQYPQHRALIQRLTRC